MSEYYNVSNLVLGNNTRLDPNKTKEDRVENRVGYWERKLGRRLTLKEIQRINSNVNRRYTS